ncbi:heparin lyase I family protein [Mobilicoccus caccae]|uniref:Polysaccharide lyase-like protein n=1 Tax=Mobilicoccus caccae TaxID=1859295 RepID=A0ABQ6IUF4_9MICO|nr:heparin lyase I family protein [Mobilicoccus caccae]GMA40696.1 hypothetical protein GCM10025883_27410 [Mobilicoccus caccae]
MNGLRLVALPVVALLSATACSAANTSPAESATATAIAVNCPEVDPRILTAVEGGAERPMCINGLWTFVVPGVDRPANPRRSELFVVADGRPVVGREGQTLHHQLEITPNLGVAGADDRHWHIAWQLHGPTNGQWKPPPVALRIRNGQLALTGGAGWPGQNWTTANHEWLRPLTSIRDGQTYRVTVDVHLSSDPAKGWVSGSVDGREVVNQWHPISRTAFRSGTLYPGQATVASRIGLYRGSQGAPPPETTQVITQRIIEARSN